VRDECPLPVTVIDAEAGWLGNSLRELWDHRELVYFLAWRDVKVRYKQTALGVAWAVVQPVFSVVIFTLFFGRLAGVPSDGVPYPLFALAGLVPWTFFSNALTLASNSLVQSAGLITKVYFPRLALPIATILAGGVDFAVTLGILAVMMAWYQVKVTLALLTIPLFVLLAFATALGVGLWFSAINVKYRDIRYTLPFLNQIWMFATPIVYPSSLLPEPWRTLYGINPMAGVVEGFRWSLLGVGGLPAMIWVSVGVALFLVITGAIYFRRTESSFADVI